MSGFGASHLGPTGGHRGTHRYRITIAGHLGDFGREAFLGLDIDRDGPDTVLAADLDQAAL